MKTLTDAPERIILGSPLLKNEYGIKAFPATVLLSEDNKVEAVLTGYNAKTVKQLEQWIESKSIK